MSISDYVVCTLIYMGMLWMVVLLVHKPINDFLANWQNYPAGRPRRSTWNDEWWLTI